MSISAGAMHSLGVQSNGSLWAWGWNQLGSLGIGSNADKNIPVMVANSYYPWASVSAGGAHSLAIQSDGSIWAWGVNDHGQLGIGSTSNTNTPNRVKTGGQWISLSAGNSHTLGIRRDGTVWSWGSNYAGELGLGSGPDITVPTQVDPVSAFTAGLASTAGSSTMHQGQYSMFNSNCGLVASVSSERASLTPVAGAVKASVWVDAAQPAHYARRHFEITPAENASGATGWVTLYLTQEEFNAFNAVNTLDLPTGPNDLTGIANLRVEKRGGVSSDNTGLPTTYPGTPLTINPADADIVWNVATGWWEVSFNVTGFSGFFVKTSENPLPVRLLSFQVRESENNAVLHWETANETNASHFEVERSIDAVHFEKIGEVRASGNTSRQMNYTFTDSHFAEIYGTLYYRLRMVDADGTFAFSRILALVHRAMVNVYPNPVRRGNTLTVVGAVPISGLTVRDISGNNVPIKVRSKADSRVELLLGNLRQGLYMLQFRSGSETFSSKLLVE